VTPLAEIALHEGGKLFTIEPTTIAVPTAAAVIAAAVPTPEL
jgi:hypothetical protein